MQEGPVSSEQPGYRQHSGSLRYGAPEYQHGSSEGRPPEDALSETLTSRKTRLDHERSCLVHYSLPKHKQPGVRGAGLR